MEIKIEIKNSLKSKTMNLSEDEFYLISHLIEKSANKELKVSDDSRIDKKLKKDFLGVIEEMF